MIDIPILDLILQQLKQNLKACKGKIIACVNLSKFLVKLPKLSESELLSITCDRVKFSEHANQLGLLHRIHRLFPKNPQLCPRVLFGIKLWLFHCSGDLLKVQYQQKPASAIYFIDLFRIIKVKKIFFPFFYYLEGR